MMGVPDDLDVCDVGTPEGTSGVVDRE